MKRRRLFRRKPDAIVIFELAASFEPDKDIARAAALLMFAELDVHPPQLLVQPGADGRLRVFGVMPRASCPVDGCVVVTLPGKPLVVVHGGGCGMTKAITRGLADGSQRPFQWCERRQTGEPLNAITPNTTKGLTK